MTIIFFAIICGLVVLIIFSGKKTGGGGTVIVADVSEILKNPDRFRNRELRVRGFIKPGSVLRYGDKADFILSHAGKEMKVRFDGSTQLPDTFADNAPARADGKLDANMNLVSNKVEAKCASKYETGYAKKKGSDPAAYSLPLNPAYRAPAPGGSSN